MGSDATTKELLTGAATEPCYRLIYRSHSLLPDGGRDQAELATILKQARSANAERGITGALMLYDDWFAQVLEGPQAAVEALYARIKTDTRHNGVRLNEAGLTPRRLFGKWAMAVVAEHHEPDMPMVATTGGLAQGAPWKVTLEQEAVLTRLRDLTRGYGRGA
jgi:Sensors of blue-light using FAD